MLPGVVAVAPRTVTGVATGTAFLTGDAADGVDDVTDLRGDTFEADVVGVFFDTGAAFFLFALFFAA